MLGFPTGSGLPSITQITFSCMLCSLPRWIGLVLVGCCFGALPRRVLPSPLWPSRNERPVGIHIFSFEACSSYHSRYGLQSCSPTLRGLCHEAPTRPVTPPSRSSATKAYRQLLGWVLPPLVICAIEAHVRFNNFHKWGDRDPPERRDPEVGPGAQILMRSGCLPLYSDVKERNATSFCDPIIQRRKLEAGRYL